MQLVLFEVCGVRFSLPLERVREVVGAAMPTPLPGAPALVEGVLDVRGEVMPVIDLRGRFGLPAESLHPDQHYLIAERARGRPVALHVGRVQWIADVAQEEISPARSFSRGAEHIAGVVRLPDGLVLIHDLDELLDEAEEEALRVALATAQHE